MTVLAIIFAVTITATVISFIVSLGEHRHAEGAFGFLIAFGCVALILGFVLAGFAIQRAATTRQCNALGERTGLDTEIVATGWGGLGWTCYVDLGDTSVPSDMLRYVNGRWEAGSS